MSSFQVKRVTLPGDTEVFYREAGNSRASTPKILLLHGFPTSSHQYRNLIPLLSPTHHVIAPDLPGFGFTNVPLEYEYTFSNLAQTIFDFVHALEIKKYAIYIFDYGAPVGLRLALKDPGAVTAIVSQNGNAYVEGLGDFWAPIKQFWQTDTPEIRQQLEDSLMSFSATKWQYEFGVSDPERVKRIEPEGYWLDQTLMERPGNKEIQLALFKDYKNNVDLYPQFQAYLREAQPPVLCVWGGNDSIFVRPGAEAFKRDVPEAEIYFYDTGHFALESYLVEISSKMLAFLGMHGV